jgi:hypothetical protein
MNPIIKFKDKPRKLQTYRVGTLNCPHCKEFSINVIIPIDKKSFEKYDEHANVCKDLKSLEDMDDSLKTPQILEQIKKNKEKIIRGYN